MTSDGLELPVGGASPVQPARAWLPCAQGALALHHPADLLAAAVMLAVEVERATRLVPSVFMPDPIGLQYLDASAHDTLLATPGAERNVLPPASTSSSRSEPWPLN